MPFANAFIISNNDHPAVSAVFQTLEMLRTIHPHCSWLQTGLGARAPAELVTEGVFVSEVFRRENPFILRR